MKLQVKSNFSFSKLANYIAAKAFSTKAGQVFGTHIADTSRKFIESGRVTPKLKKSTIQIRNARGTGGSRPLYETGALAKSLKATKDGQLKMLHYGKNHLEGFKPKQIPFKVVAGEKEWFMPNTKGIRVEARNFISYGNLTEPFKEVMANIRKAFKK